MTLVDLRSRAACRRYGSSSARRQGECGPLGGQRRAERDATLRSSDAVSPTSPGILTADDGGVGPRSAILVVDHDQAVARLLAASRSSTGDAVTATGAERRERPGLGLVHDRLPGDSAAAAVEPLRTVGGRADVPTVLMPCWGSQRSWSPERVAR